MSLTPFLRKITAHEALTSQEAREAMGVLLEGRAGEALIAAFLLGLREKGETADELAGFAEGLREHMIGVDAGSDLVDTCGTGGDGSNTFNISTVAAFVLAGAGAKVAKHGNRSISSLTGSADVLEALGIGITATPEQAAGLIQEIGIAFLFAPAFHPAMKHVQPVRRALKVRTVFNLLGPLANPAGVRRQVIGAPSPEAAALMAEALHRLGAERAFVVHGCLPDDKGANPQPLDEISTAGTTQAHEVETLGVTRFEWSPSDFGVALARASDLAGGDVKHNAGIALEILGGAKGPRRDIVLVNAAAGLIVAGLAHDFVDGVKMAAESIDSGSAIAKLNALREAAPLE